MKSFVAQVHDHSFILRTSYTFLSYPCAGRISDDLKAKYKDEAVLGVDIHDKDATYRRLVPYQFKHIVERSVIPDTRRYYWWRGISATYLLRPNYYMKIVLDRFSSPTAKMLSGKCVGKNAQDGIA